MRTTKVAFVLAGALAVLVPACFGGGETEAGLEQDVTSPTNLTITVAGTSELDLRWDAVAGAAKYYVLRGPSPGTEGYFTTARLNAYNDTHLAAGTQYCYEVEAVIANVASAPSTEVCATTASPPAGPTNVTATAVSTTRAQINWDAYAGATKYYVNVSTAGGPYGYLGTATTNGYTASSLTPSTSYCFEIQAVTATGTTANSAAACTSTFAGGLEAWWKFNEKSGTVAKDSSGNGRNGTIAGGVTYSTTDRPPVADDFSSLSFGGASTDAVTVPYAPQLANADQFTIAVWVKLPAAPTGTVAFMGERAAGCGAVTWELGQDAAGLYVAGANTVRFGGNLPVGAWTHVAVTRTGGTTSLYLNGTFISTVSYITGADTGSSIELGNSGDCNSGGGAFLLDEPRIYSGALTSSDISDLGTQPDAPTGLAGTSPSPTAMNLSWNSVTNAQKYFVLRSTTSGSEALVNTVFAPTTSYSDTHLAAGTTYYYQVQVQAHGLVSKPSAEITAQTQQGPQPPATVTATASTSTQIDLSWSAASGAVKYYVYQSVNGAAYTFRNTVLAPATTYTDRPLTSGTSYCYEIVTEGAGQLQSQPSSPACATTP